jgi:osmoprotectant transport system ATP-binding protein
LIRFENVSKTYGAHTAIHPLDLEIPAQHTLALIGPSGCGKSTLMRMAVGLIRTDSGAVSVAGEVMTPATARKLRLRIGYVIQEGGLFPHLTAADNVTLMAREIGWDVYRANPRLKELADLVHLPLEMLDRYPSQLSGGQRQRVGLMRALMLDPEVVLMDEPLGALDPLIRSQLQDDLREIFRTLKKTVLLVTHDMGEAAYLGDEVALMRDGRILQRGSARELVQEPADPFVREFVQAQRPGWVEEVQ